MNQTYDIVILGGGIAGNAVAYNMSLLRPFAKIAIVDPLEYGELKVSVVTFMEHLKRYKITNSVIHTYSKQRFESISNIGYSTDLEEEAFALIDYGVACRTLQERSGSEIIRDRFMKIDGEEIVLESGLRLTSKYIVDTMGLFSPLRDQMGLEKPELRTVLLFGKYKVNPAQIRLDTFSYIVGNGVFDGYTSNGGWAYPCGEDIVEVGSAFLVWDKDGRIKIDQRMRSALENSLEQILQTFFPGAELQDELHERITAYSPTKTVVKDNVLFLGDVAGTGDPFLCANCSRYLDMSEYLTAALAAAVQEGNDRHLQTYQKAWNYELVHYSKRRLGRAEILFKKSLEQWNKILMMRKNKSSKKTLASRMGKVGYTLKYTLQRYPLRDVFSLLLTEIKFHWRMRLINPKRPDLKYFDLIRDRQEDVIFMTPSVRYLRKIVSTLGGNK